MTRRSDEAAVAAAPRRRTTVLERLPARRITLTILSILVVAAVTTGTWKTLTLPAEAGA